MTLYEFLFADGSLLTRLLNHLKSGHLSTTCVYLLKTGCLKLLETTWQLGLGLGIDGNNFIKCLVCKDPSKILLPLSLLERLTSVSQPRPPATAPATPVMPTPRTRRPASSRQKLVSFNRSSPAAATYIVGC